MKLFRSGLHPRLTALAVALTLPAVVVTAANPLAPAVPPEQLGFSSQRLERVGELMQRHIDGQAFPGAVTLIARDDQVVFFRAQGLMDLETGRPMQPDTVFRVMSMTKPVVAVAILMLAETGKLQLNDPVGKFIPELQTLMVAESAEAVPVPAMREITLRDLLTHTSGLMSGGASNRHRIAIGPGDSVADVVPRLGKVPLDFQPGTRWAYSPQFGFDVLVRVAEVASGQSFDAFAKQHIFDPLGMKDTFFQPGADRSRIATLYRRRPHGLEKEPEQAFVNGIYVSGGGGLFSTAADYLKFALMLLHGGRDGETRLLNRETVELMLSVVMPIAGEGNGVGMGLGVRVVTDAAARPRLLSTGSFGWSGVFNTHFFVDPHRRVVGIFLTQSAFLEHRRQIRDDFETAVMQALVDEPPR